MSDIQQIVHCYREESQTGHTATCLLQQGVTLPAKTIVSRTCMRRLPLPPVMTVSGDMLPSAMGVRPEPVRLPYPTPSRHPISVHEAACTRRDYPPLCLKQACRFWRIKRSWADSPGRSPWERVMMKRLVSKQRPFAFKLPRNRFTGRAGQPLLFSVLA